MNEKSLSDKEERLLSALAHGSIVIQMFGILVGVILYVTHRDRSQRVAFQALQAAVYQATGAVLTGMLWMVWFIFYLSSFVPMMQNPEAFKNAPPPLFFISMFSMIVPAALTFVWWLYGLVGALQTLRGRDFRYIIIGGLLA